MIANFILLRNQKERLGASEDSSDSEDNTNLVTSEIAYGLTNQMNPEDGTITHLLGKRQ